MHWSIVMVTPEMAARWLEEFNSHNRPLRLSLVKFYANQMRLGLWMLTHQGIAFSVNGTLIDGQHRLAAVVMSGVSVKFWVCRGADMESQIVVDDHAKRTPLDAMSLASLSLNGELTKNYVATARAMMISSSWSYKWSKVELRDFIEAHHDAISYGNRLITALPHKVGLTQATIGAVVGRAFYHGAGIRGEQFAHILYTGQYVAQEDQAAFRLRENLLTGGRAGRASSDRAIVHKCAERALRAFMDREPLSKIYPASKELFPLPGEVEQE